MKFYTFLTLCLIAGLASLAGIPLHPEASLALFAFGATALKVSGYSDTAPMQSGEGHEQVVRSETFNLSAALVINDTIDFFRIPKGARVNFVEMISDDLDSNGTPLITLNLGLKGGTGTEFFSASTLGQAGGLARSTAHPLDMTGDDVLRAKVAAAPATGATSGKLSVNVGYTMPTF